MTYLALNNSDYINGVAIKHKEVSGGKHMQDVYNKHLDNSWIKTP